MTVSAVLSDNVGITSAFLHWSLSPGGPFTPVAMSEAKYEGTYESAPIGPFVDDTRVFYYVECADADGMDARRPSAGSKRTTASVESPHSR